MSNATLDEIGRVRLDVAIDDSEDYCSSYIIGLPDLTPRMPLSRACIKV